MVAVLLWLFEDTPPETGKVLLMLRSGARRRHGLFWHKKTIEIDEKGMGQEEYVHLKIERKRTIARMIVIVLAAAVIVIALSIAWFVSNTRVHSTGTAISADMKTVELRTYGGAGIHDDLLKKITQSEQATGSESFWYELEDTVKNFFETSSQKYAINWLLSEDSNVGNYSTDQPDWEEYWKNPPQGVERQDRAIEPGSSGRLTFYVVPKYDGAVKLNMNLSMIPYKVEDDKFTEITEEKDKIAKSFVEGHILFFVESGTENAKEIQWIKDGTFQISIADAKKDQEYGYTLYWCWPQSFGEAVLKAGDSYLNERAILFSEFTNCEEMRKIISQTDDLSMVKKPERYFYSSLTKNPLSADQKELTEIENMYDKSSAELSDDAKNAFVDLSSYYNQADQYIGSHVDCIRIKLEAEEENVYGESSTEDGQEKE